MKMIRVLVVAALLTILFVGSVHGDTRTTRGKLKAIKEKSTELTIEEVGELPVLPSDSLTITGYDKALRSGRESLLLTNYYGRRMTEIVVDLVYNEAETGRMLHARRVKLACDIPPGETRQAEWSAWDKQNRYYYYDTRVTPRSNKAIPYKVEIFPREVKFSEKVD